MILTNKIKTIYPQIKDSDFLFKIRIQDDGAGAYIASWNYPGLAQPTAEQLAALENTQDPTPVPEAVTPWQARAALLDAGLLDTVNALVNQQSTAVKMKWEFASEIRRDDSLIASLAGSLGLSSAQLDALFIAATSYT